MVEDSPKVILLCLGLFFFFSEFYLCFQLCWVFVAASRFFSSCGEQGLLFIAVCGLLIAVASLIAEHGI